MERHKKHTPSTLKRTAKVNSSDIKIEELNKEIIELREIIYKQRDEIHALRNSRVLGRIIKVRDSIGNPYTLPHRSVNKVRREVAKYIPDSIRLPLMKSLRSTRSRAKSKINQFRHRLVTISTVTNTKWPSAKPIVSVVIPYYNRFDTIDETLESLRNQTFQNFEVIIVDDNSSDQKSINKLDSLNGVKVVRHKVNEGVAKTRNDGIALSVGKYILCLDSDDMLEDTFIEKAVAVLETSPDVSLVSTYQDAFGVVNELFEKHPYNPYKLYEDNMVITAALFRREAWEATGGYKPDIGYEDWEYWLTLAENGYWGKQLPEPLFKYRTSMYSRYVGDKDVHWNNIKIIHDLHSGYKRKIRTLEMSRRSVRKIIASENAMVNLNESRLYKESTNSNPNILIAMPWMTFGGAETLIYNLCRQTSNDFNISFITGLKSENEWEYKFKEISKNIYHLANLFDDNSLYAEFVINYVKTRKIDILHIIHTDFVFPMLHRLKHECPNVKVIVTMFNDRVPNYVTGVVDHQEYIDILTSDNQKTTKSFKDKLLPSSNIKLIPNGINGDKEFSLELFNRRNERHELGIRKDDLSVFFVGRLSEEKNPDVFVRAAEIVLSKNDAANVKFFVIGDGPMRNDIEKQIKKLSSKNIVYLGYQAEVARYLSAADVFVLPSSIEGFPLSILEAMAMKVVVIASRVGAIPDVIDHGQNGFIIEPGSADEIADTVLDLNKDRRRVEKIKLIGRDILEKKYSHTQLGKNYKGLYREAIK